MDTFIRIATACNKIKIANPLENSKNIIALIEKISLQAPSIILFPKDCLTGGYCGDLLENGSIRLAFDMAVECIIEFSNNIESLIIIHGINRTYLIHKGGLVEYDGGQFTVNNVEFNMIVDNIDNLQTLQSGVTLVQSYSKATALSDVKFREKLISLSDKYAIVVSNGTVGDTSSPCVTRAFCGIFEASQELCYTTSFDEEIFVIADLDTKIICNRYEDNGVPDDFNLLRKLEKQPYLPSNLARRREYLNDLFILQAESIAIRLRNIGLQKLVIGISGGLDSTIALLVATKAMDILSYPHSNIIAVTMKGMGTTDLTYNNAVKLMKTLNVQAKNIPITDSVMLHLESIGHSLTEKDVTYENAQARERTQILFSLANWENALVVGTGDLSEMALGFCTFGGDQLASYNVNASIPKSTLRALLQELADTQFIALKETLYAILKTPISPELIPPDENGLIVQKTEELLGDYELHDFFLYYLLKYNFSKNRLFIYAKYAFKGQYSEEYIENKLSLLLNRMTRNQFKRSCSVDGAVVTELSMSKDDFFMPSDLSTIF